MLPTFIRSAADFHAAVQLGSTPESLVLEFKSKIDGWNTPTEKKEVRKKAQKETCRDIVQFANTLGGCLLIGVDSERDSSRDVLVAKSIIPIHKVEELWEWITQAVSNYLVPSTFTHDIVPITLTQQENVLAVNVAASRHLVALWDWESHTIEYVRRNSYGKDWMNPDEVERHLMDGSRAAKLALIAAIDRARDKQVEIAGGLWLAEASHVPKPLSHVKPITFGRMEDYWFELRIELTGLKNQPEVFSVTIPYSLIKETWINSDGSVTLLLAVRIVARGIANMVGRVMLEPYSA
jgi:hypothetical protein